MAKDTPATEAAPAAATGYVVVNRKRPIHSTADGKHYAYGQTVDLAHLKRSEIDLLTKAGHIATADTDAAQKAVAFRAAQED